MTSSDEDSQYFSDLGYFSFIVLQSNCCGEITDVKIPGSRLTTSIICPTRAITIAGRELCVDPETSKYVADVDKRQIACLKAQTQTLSTHLRLLQYKWLSRQYMTPVK
uniref:Chemokine interleukin-8-like domain-containing protein n=1 Tax=Cyprinus carpio carpio TaxID=630221 RepID=A0A9J7YML0_CYPCA